MIARRFGWIASVTAALLAPSMCSAATVAFYQMTFDATWSAATHPQDFPGASAHFSSLIGGVHNANASFWALGQQATLGIQRMAELGSTTQLRNEVLAAIGAGTAYEVIQGSGAASPGVGTASFSVSADFPLVSLTTMIAPSPDWFVGVHDLALFDNGNWLTEIVVPLWPYDAGTDSGATFTSANLATNPHVPIAQITGFPFAGAGPLGTFTFRRLPTGDVNFDGVVDIFDVAAISSHWGESGPDGDANFDGSVDIFDVAVVSNNWTIEESLPTPEPSACALAAIGVVAFGAGRVTTRRVAAATRC